MDAVQPPLVPFWSWSDKPHSWHRCFLVLPGGSRPLALRRNVIDPRAMVLQSWGTSQLPDIGHDLEVSRRLPRFLGLPPVPFIVDWLLLSGPWDLHYQIRQGLVRTQGGYR